MTRNITPTRPDTTALIAHAWDAVSTSFERFCLTAGVATLARMMEEDATQLCGRRYGRSSGKVAHRWGKTLGKIGLPGGKIAVERPRVRARSGAEVALPSWEAAMAEDWLGQWA
jgi:putative transposase